MRGFYVYRRPNGFYYCELLDPVTGVRIASRSTGMRERDHAVIIANDWATNGLPSPDGQRRSLAETASFNDIIRFVRNAPLSETEALRIVKELEERGLVSLDLKAKTGPASEPFGPWLCAFWNYDTSQYIKERLAHGQRATRRHCQDMEGRAREIEALLPPGITLSEVKRAHLVALGLALKEKGLAPATINKDLSAATTALRWAAANEIIPTDPTRGLRGFSGQRKRRGILEPAEVKALFSMPWEDERARVASLTSATTSARLGEVLAIQFQDIGEDRLHIRHSYSIKDGLKTTKNGEEREVPLLPIVRDALLALDAKNLRALEEKRARLPETERPEPAGPDRFVFAGTLPDRPIDANRILLGFRKALVAMNGGMWGSDKKPEEKQAREKVLAEYAARGIDFHSWRHWYAKMMADRLDSKAVQRATGHKTAAMLEHYADHIAAEDLMRLGVAAGEAFGGLIRNGINMAS